MSQITTTRRIHLLANAKSGQGHGAKLSELAQEICDEHGLKLVHYNLESAEDLDAKTQEAISAAQNDPHGIVVAAGGDGTLRSVAEKIYRSGATSGAVNQVTFAIVPCGTFNFFARAHQIPEDHEEALRLAVTGKSQPVRLGELNKRIFLINASLGLYAKSIVEREESTQRFGRNRVVVLCSTVWTLLKPHRLLSVKFVSKGREQEVRTPMIFIGNNSLQLRNLSLSVADCMKRHLLAVVMLKPVRGVEMIRVLFRGLARTLENEERLEQFCTAELKIEAKRRCESVALDGEMFEMTSPFELRSIPDAIQMIKPELPT